MFADVPWPTRIKRAIAALAAIAWILLGVYLVFLSGDSPKALSPVAEAAERTASYPGYRVETTGSIQAAGLALQMHGEGAFNGETDRAQLRLTASGGPPPIGSFTIEEVVDGLAVYMSSPLFTAGLPEGKSWMKLDLSEFGSASTGDPRQMLDQLRAVSPNVTELGVEEVRGVPATHYAAVIDLNREIELLRDQGQEEAAELAQKLLDAGQPAEIPTEVWIDGDGLIRREVTTLPFDAVAGAGSSATMSVDFFDFGAEPEVVIPPEEAVFDATDLAKESIEQLGR